MFILKSIFLIFLMQLKLFLFLIWLTIQLIWLTIQLITRFLIQSISIIDQTFLFITLLAMLIIYLIELKFVTPSKLNLIIIFPFIFPLNQFNQLLH